MPPSAAVAITRSRWGQAAVAEPGVFALPAQGTRVVVGRGRDRPQILAGELFQAGMLLVVVAMNPTRRPSRLPPAVSGVTGICPRCASSLTRAGSGCQPLANSRVV
jgi:hypothetical protein